MINPLTGTQLIANASLFDRIQIQFPKSKKRRIRKKWTKRVGNFKHVPQQTVYVLTGGNIMIAHPVMIAKLEAAAKNASNADASRLAAATTFIPFLPLMAMESIQWPTTGYIVSSASTYAARECVAHS